MSEVTELHEPFRRWLDGQGLRYRYSRPDKATSENASDADFWIVADGRILMIEFKQPKTGKLSTKQVFRHAELAAAGCRVFVLRDLESAMNVVTAWRMLGPPEDRVVNERLEKLTWEGIPLRQLPDGTFERVKNA